MLSVFQFSYITQTCVNLSDELSYTGARLQTRVADSSIQAVHQYQLLAFIIIIIISYQLLLIRFIIEIISCQCIIYYFLLFCVVSVHFFFAFQVLLCFLLLFLNSGSLFYKVCCILLTLVCVSSNCLQCDVTCLL